MCETHGKLSIMIKEEQQPVTKKDQNILTVKPSYIPMELVSDGKVVEKNFLEAGVSLEWLDKQLSLMTHLLLKRDRKNIHLNSRNVANSNAVYVLEKKNY